MPLAHDTERFHKKVNRSRPPSAKLSPYELLVFWLAAPVWAPFLVLLVLCVVIVNMPDELKVLFALLALLLYLWFA